MSARDGVPVVQAWRHYCPRAGCSHARPGKPRSSRCPGCGSTWITQGPGGYYVLPWRHDGRYVPANALRGPYRSELNADVWLMNHVDPTKHCVRFLTFPDEPGPTGPW